MLQNRAGKKVFLPRSLRHKKHACKGKTSGFNFRANQTQSRTCSSYAEVQPILHSVKRPPLRFLKGISFSFSFFLFFSSVRKNIIDEVLCSKAKESNRKQQKPKPQQHHTLHVFLQKWTGSKPFLVNTKSEKSTYCLTQNSNLWELSNKVS